MLNRNSIKKLHNFAGEIFHFKKNIRSNNKICLRLKQYLCQRISTEKHIYFVKDRLAKFKKKRGNILLDSSLAYRMGLKLPFTFHASICLSTLSNTNISETSLPIKIKFHLQHYLGKGYTSV